MARRETRPPWSSRKIGKSVVRCTQELKSSLKAERTYSLAEHCLLTIKGKLSLEEEGKISSWHNIFIYFRAGGCS